MDIRGAANGEKNVCLWTVVLAGGFALAFRSLSALSTPPPPPPPPTLSVGVFWPDKHHYSVC